MEPHCVKSTKSINFCESEKDSNDSASTINVAKKLCEQYLSTINKNNVGDNKMFFNKKHLESLHGYLTQMKSENERLHHELLKEKNRSQKYIKKIQTTQSNQIILEQLKQAYLSMKANKEIEKKKPTVEDKCCQKEEIIEKKISLDEKIQCNNLDDQLLPNTEYLTVRKREFEGIQSTVQDLKAMIISQPLQTFVISEERENKYRKDIILLFQENRSLKQLLINKQLEFEDMKKTLEPKNNMFKKIIAKMAINKLDSIRNAPKTNCVYLDFNEKELKLIEQIANKFELKLKQKKYIKDYDDTINESKNVQNTNNNVDDRVVRTVAETILEKNEHDKSIESSITIDTVNEDQDSPTTHIIANASYVTVSPSS